MSKAGYYAWLHRPPSAHDVADAALAWAQTRLSASQPMLFYATADASAVKAVQAQLGVSQAGEAVEGVLSAIAHGLVEQGVRQLVVAPENTSPYDRDATIAITTSTASSAAAPGL